jgi:hypothetical protein
MLKSRYLKLLAEDHDISFSRNIRRIFLEYLEDSYANSIKAPSRLVQQILKWQSQQKNPDKSLSRNILTRLLPWNPLRGMPPNPLHLFVLTSPKDIELLPYSLISSLQSCEGEISQITVVMPENSLERANEILQEIKRVYPLVIRTDEEILEKHGLRRENFLSGHPVMITLKYLCVLDSGIEDNLVTDGDTLFLRKKTWSSGNSVILTAAQEYQPMHMNYCRGVFNLQSNSGYGFTTQSQLFRKSNVEQIVQYIGSAKKLGLNFAEYYANYMSGLRLDLFPADWQLHSDWTIEKTDLNFRISGYSNIGMSRAAIRFPLIVNPTIQDIDSLLETARKTVPTLGSLSLHDYK